jgi:UDP:flavonoid glycosyltransferase YjiC (YdhE family)
MIDSVAPHAQEPRRRVLFVGEAVTLAHVARPVALAQVLDPDLYDICLAVDPRYSQLLGSLTIPVRPIRSIPAEQFLAALARGAPLYSAETLRAYVKEDLQLLGAVAPDLVVGDFRLSLGISARLAKVPYVAISNAYWSPFARVRFPMPELPMVRYLGVTLARILFRVGRPVAFAMHTRPMNRVRREHGLPGLGYDLCRVYTDADYTLYADVPELVPVPRLPDNHEFIGPILWSPPVKPPDWWDQLPADRPVIYVTMGSSGASESLERVLSALRDLRVTVMAATAGRISPAQATGNALVADFLPGEAAAARAALVICNGGSPTTHQALAAGRPVLGIASNMDQHLNMEAVQRAGAGELLRAGRADAFGIRSAVERILADPSYTAAAGRLARAFSHYHAPSRFQALIKRVLNSSPREASLQQARAGSPDRSTS